MMKRKFNIFLLCLFPLCVATSFCNNNFDFSLKQNPGFTYLNLNKFNEDFATYESVPSDDLFSNEMITYFYNLYSFSPENSYNSCGYVSFIQYLSYFDSFYNDAIIPEQYERNQGSSLTFADARLVSPGVIRQTYPDNSIDLYNFVQNNKDSDYQMELMYLVNENYCRNASNYDSSIGMWDYDIIVDSIPALSNSSFEFTSYNDFGVNAKPTDTNVISWFDSYVKNQLDDGYPVMLHIAMYNEITDDLDGYHSVVAYYYDNDGIHANFGWGSDSTDVIISDDYQITEAGCIDFSDVTEIHSNNFVVNDIGYCGCGLQHVHNYTYDYSHFLPSKHRAYCCCGASKLETHAIRFGSTFIQNGHKYAYCLFCGDLVDTTTNIVIVIH